MVIHIHSGRFAVRIQAHRSTAGIWSECECARSYVRSVRVCMRTHVFVCARFVCDFNEKRHRSSSLEIWKIKQQVTKSFDLKWIHETRMKLVRTEWIHLSSCLKAAGHRISVKFLWEKFIEMCWIRIQEYLETKITLENNRNILCSVKLLNIYQVVTKNWHMKAVNGFRSSKTWEVYLCQKCFSSFLHNRKNICYLDWWIFQRISPFGIVVIFSRKFNRKNVSRRDETSKTQLNQIKHNVFGNLYAFGALVGVFYICKIIPLWNYSR